MNSIPQSLRNGLDGFIRFLPSLIGGLLILLVGYIVAKVLRRVTRTLLHRFGFDRLMQRLGVADRYDDPEAGSRWVAMAVFVVVIVATLMQTAVAWKLTFVAVGLAGVLAYLPHVLAAVVIFGAAILVGNWVRDRILSGATRPLRSISTGTSFGDHRIMASAVRAGILALGGFMALRELQISAEIVTIAFTLVLGAIALAAALAFGLGSRDVAGHVAREWYNQRTRGPSRSRDVTPRDDERFPDEQPPHHT